MRGTRGSEAAAHLRELIAGLRHTLRAILNQATRSVLGPG